MADIRTNDNEDVVLVEEPDLSFDFEDIFEDVDLFYSGETETEIGESENLFIEAKKAYNKVDDKLLDFIGNFVVNQDNAAKQKKRLKNVFFWFTMVSFGVIVLTPIVCLVVLLYANVDEYYIVFGGITASIIEVLTTIIVLPKIVAEYLFNKEEENSNIKIVELMQKYSEMIHGYDKEK